MSCTKNLNDPFINGCQYVELANIIGDAFLSQQIVAPVIESGLNIVVLLDQADQEFDLLNSWYTAEQTLSALAGSSSNFLQLAQTLNRHIETRTGLSVNVYLANESVGAEISCEFAKVSKDAGTTIDCAFVTDGGSCSYCAP